MITKLPDESDPKRAEAEEVAKAVTAGVYGGKLRHFFSPSPFEINVLQLGKLARIRSAPNNLHNASLYLFIYSRPSLPFKHSS